MNKNYLHKSWFPTIDYEIKDTSLTLSALKSSISDFVFILTNKNIPVKFYDGTPGGFTTGKEIQISAELSEEFIDSTVGVALHESAHIIHTDFSLFNSIDNGNYEDEIVNELYAISEKKGFDKDDVNKLLILILNVVEDRFIDNDVYKRVPGYRGYYDAMYNRFFYSDYINESLKNDKIFTEETLDSYEFKIINIMNENIRLNSLNGLQEIYNILDLNTIDRLNKPLDRFKVAVDITKIVLNNINDLNKKCIEHKSSSTDESSNKNDFSTNPSNNSNFDLTKLKEVFEKQKRFLKNDFEKESCSPKDANKLDILEESVSDIKIVGNNEYFRKNIKCVVMNTLNKKIINSSEFPLSTGSISKLSNASVNDGINLGKILGKKLKIRMESRNTIFNRQTNGKIDRRLISELSFDNCNIFKKIHTEQYKQVHLHISVDASHSMKIKNAWGEALMCCVAICKASTMVENINVVVSFRTTCFEKNQTPMVVIAYDSTRDKFSKIRDLFPYLRPNGNTPEGLAYQAISSKIPASNFSEESFLLNLSDGEPHMPFDDHGVLSCYCGESALKHTKSEINKLKKLKNINVLSFFINSMSDYSFRDFKKMYGDDAKQIDVSNITQIARVINKKLLEK